MEPTEENLRAWNELQRRRAERVSAPGLRSELRDLLPDLSGKHVLHLQCGTGEATAQLVELGALVTGIDLDEDALAEARRRAPTALFVRAELHELPSPLRRRRSDLVYGGPGLLGAIDDLPTWAGEAAAALRAGGLLVVHDAHPVAECVEPTTLRWRADYFGLRAQLGVIVTAVAGAGLVLERLVELRLPDQPRRQDPRVPGEFVLIARKP